jgi:Recombination endonuclease VII
VGLTKRCSDCDEHRPIEEFGKNRATKDGLTSYCRFHHYERGRKNRDPRERHLRDRYGITKAQFAEMETAQGGVCASCKCAVVPRRVGRTVTLVTVLDVDHCHTTGEVRGLLCNGCNVAIGRMKDDPNRLRAAAVYLMAYEPEQTVWA